jgi:Ser/Thr protein kinase RdoA (MazF antagonist)
MAFSPYIQNIAVSMSQLIFSYNWKPSQAGLFIEGYRMYHPLSDEELDLLYDLTLARYAILIIEMNHWNVRFGIDDQRMEFVNDNYRFLQRFLELGKQDFNHVIGV